MSFDYKKYVDDIRSLGELKIIINYYFPSSLNKNKMVCPFHSDKNPSFYVKEGSYGAFYKCFGCGETGDIISFIRKVENISFMKALKKAYEILGKPLDLPKYNKKENYHKPTYSKNNMNTNNQLSTLDYYNKKIKNAKSKGLDYIAKEYEILKIKEETTNYNIDFIYKDQDDKVLKVWENLECILTANNIEAVYNEISKNIEIYGTSGKGLNEAILDIHTLCNKYDFKLSTKQIGEFINRIGMDNKKNPVREYLEFCESIYKNEDNNIDKLCDCIITEDNYNLNLKKILITKWLINTARIVYNNEGNMNVEGVLTLQGSQGLGKTRFIKEIIPMYVKTGIDLDPSDKDKINQCIKYWVCELGELDSTLKKDLAKLKAFLTEQEDEYRKPYAAFPIKYPRMTSFYATVNQVDFLKDETGNRRYWVIPVKKIDFDKLKELEIEQLWGEVMHILCENKYVHYLTNDEMNMLNESNEEFMPYGKVQVMVESGFEWNAPKDKWCWMSSSEIARTFGLKSTKGLRSVMENYGASCKIRNGIRGYVCPNFIRIY